jgi:hypothetical protein
MSTGWIIALVCGGLIIAGLAFYLGRLLLLLRLTKQRSEAKQAEKVTQRNKTLSESIYTIAWAMRDGQCEFSEGCLRVWVLLDHYVDNETTDNTQVYPGIFKLYKRIKDMPTHEARKKQKRSEQMAMDSDRVAAEKEYKDLIALDIAHLIKRFEV